MKFKGKLVFEKVDPMTVTFRLEGKNLEKFHSALKFRLKRDAFPKDFDVSTHKAYGTYTFDLMISKK